LPQKKKEKKREGTMEETICSHQAIFVICVQILYNKDTII
jgi:hypothetical protein